VQGAPLSHERTLPFPALHMRQCLPSSPAAIAQAALRKRESLSRDVARELHECMANCGAAAAERQDVEFCEAQEGYGWKMSGDGEEGTGFEDDMFAFTDEPCNVCFAAVFL
jgi:hypothetical protein